MAFRDDHTLTLPGLDTPEAPRRSDAPPSRQAGARRAPGRGTRGEPPAGAEGVKNDPGALIEAEAEPAEETTETQRMGDDKARYAKHFAIGVRSVTGDAGFGLLSGEYGELADICTRRALSPEGKRLMKGKLDAWLEENAAAFARETSGERRKFNPLTPRSFERWLRDKAEGAPAQAQRHPGTYHGQMVQTDEAARRERDRLAKNPNPNTAALDRHIAELEASGVNVDGDDWEFANFGAKRAAGAR